MAVDGVAVIEGTPIQPGSEGATVAHAVPVAIVPGGDEPVIELAQAIAVDSFGRPLDPTRVHHYMPITPDDNKILTVSRGILGLLWPLSDAASWAGELFEARQETLGLDGFTVAEITDDFDANSLERSKRLNRFHKSLIMYIKEMRKEGLGGRDHEGMIRHLEEDLTKRAGEVNRYLLEPLFPWIRSYYISELLNDYVTINMHIDNLRDPLSFVRDDLTPLLKEETVIPSRFNRISLETTEERASELPITLEYEAILRLIGRPEEIPARAQFLVNQIACQYNNLTNEDELNHLEKQFKFLKEAHTFLWPTMDPTFRMNLYSYFELDPHTELAGVTAKLESDPSNEILIRYKNFLTDLISPNIGPSAPLHPLIELLQDLEHKEVTESDKESLNNEIKKLNPEESGKIYQAYYDTFGNDSDEWEWSEHHITENIPELLDMTTKILFPPTLPTAPPLEE